MQNNKTTLQYPLDQIDNKANKRKMNENILTYNNYIIIWPTEANQGLRKVKLWLVNQTGEGIL